MTKRSEAKYKIDRRMGQNIWGRPKSPVNRREYGPGQHGRARKKQDSNYAVQLREKQRLRAQYNIREAQMRRVYLEAKRIEGQTGKNMIEILETRLDALVLRAGFARTIAQARQAVVHRHIMVDGVRVDRPSFKVKPGQLIHVHPKSEKMTPFQVAATGEHQAVLPDTPAYLNVEIEKLHAKLERAPKREEIPVTCEEQLVVEYYSRLA